MTTLEVLFTPADFAFVKQRDLSQTTCVVFDVLRATSTMVTALSNGATSILPAEEIEEALALRRTRPDVLLAGERDGLRITSRLTGSIDFDLGNSPREFVPEMVRGRSIVMTTTNGTRALRSSAGAREVLVGSLLNLQATANYIFNRNVENLLIICSGTFDQAAYEDTLGAGALCELLWSKFAAGAVADSAWMARQLYLPVKDALTGALAYSRNGRRLLGRPDLRDDVAFCARRDLFSIVAAMSRDGIVEQISIDGSNDSARGRASAC